MSTLFKNIVDFIEKDYAMLSRAADWDNSGIQLATNKTSISRVAFAVNASRYVVNKAISEGCELLITHHPLFFKPIKSLDISKADTSFVFNAIENGLNICSYHTNVDSADYSPSEHVIKLLGANTVGLYSIQGYEPCYKVTVFIPKEYQEGLLDAVDRAGGAKLGKYTKCSFRLEGSGTFLPDTGAKPYTGAVGELSDVKEYRLEFLCKASKLSQVKDAIRSNHPYEEPAFDVYELENIKDYYGYGRIGSFENGISVSKLIEKLMEITGLESIGVNNDSDFSFRNFAIIPGSAASMWRECLEKKLDLFITGDLTHHHAIEAHRAGVTIIDAGHYALESLYFKHLANVIAEQFDIEAIIIEEESDIYHRRS